MHWSSMDVEAGNYSKASFSGSVNLMNSTEIGKLSNASVSIPNFGWVSVANGSLALQKDTCTTVNIHPI